MKKQTLLLVTGSHSCGKSWLSKILTKLTDLTFIHEPLNPFSPPGIMHKSENQYWRRIDRSSKNGIKFTAHLYGKKIPIFEKTQNFRDYVSKMKSTLNRQAAFKKANLICIKDPFSVFSVDSYSQHQNYKILYLFRDPKSFVANSVKHGFGFSTDRFDNDGEIFRSCDEELAFYLNKICKDTDLTNGDLIMQNIAYWSIVYKYIISKWATYGNNRFISLETINKDPFKSISKLCKWLDIFAPESIIVETTDTVIKSTQTDNIIQRKSDLEIWSEQQNNEYLQGADELIKERCGDIYDKLKELEYSSWKTN